MVRSKAPPRHAEVRPLKCVVYITRNPVTFEIHWRREFSYWISKHVRQNTKQSTRGMSTCCPRHLQLPLRPRTLLIADVTRLQPFTVGGDSFRENLETLVSYNVRNDGMLIMTIHTRTT